LFANMLEKVVETIVIVCAFLFRPIAATVV